MIGIGRKQWHLPSSSNDESKLGFGFNEVVTSVLSLSSGVNESSLLILVLLVVLLSVGNEGLSLISSLLLLLVSSLFKSLQELGVSGLFLLHVLRNNSIKIDDYVKHCTDERAAFKQAGIMIICCESSSFSIPWHCYFFLINND